MKQIADNYIDARFDNSSLLGILNRLDDVQLQVVKGHIMEVEEKYGECNLQRVIKKSTNLSVRTDHPEDGGVTYDQSIYQRY